MLNVKSSSFLSKNNNNFNGYLIHFDDFKKFNKLS